MTTPGTAVPGTVVPASSLVATGGAQGIQGTQGQQGTSGIIVAGFVLLTSNYNVLSADNGKYFICSGGSWTLNLPTPAPANGFFIRVRNDQGITGTTGTITLSPASGTIDGLASLALLPGQECMLITDGTNWRTHGRQRNVVIGTIDITSAVAAQIILLPVGYRLFEVNIYGIQPVTNTSFIEMLCSINGGASFLSSNYTEGTLYNSSATAAAFSFVASTNTFARISGGMNSSTAHAGQVRIMIAPNPDGIKPATWVGQGFGYATTGPWTVDWAFTGGCYSMGGVLNAIQLLFSTGNISVGSILVKGIV